MPAGAAPEHELTLDLLENGIDFVKSGIETYFLRDTPNPRAHKYAILHMFSGTLLLLKERLRRIDPALVFEGTGPNTVKFAEALKRLKNNGVVITPAHLAILWKTQKRRNEIEYYAVALGLDEAKEIIADLAAFVHSFCIDQLQFHIEERFRAAAQRRFYELKAVGDKMYELVLQDMDAEAAARTAWWEEMVAKYSALSPEAVLEIAAAESGVDLGSLTLIECPDCEAQSLTFVEGEVAVCTSETCGSIRECAICRSCGGLSFFPSQWCNDCRNG